MEYGTEMREWRKSNKSIDRLGIKSRRIQYLKMRNGGRKLMYFNGRKAIARR